MLLLLLLLGYGAAEKSILIIGGLYSNGTVEKFNPRTMESTIIQQHFELTSAGGIVHGNVGLSAAPVNDTHAFLIVYRAMGGTDIESTHYIERSGRLTDGPKIPNKASRKAFTFHLTSLPSCSANGQRRPIYCFMASNQTHWHGGKECHVLSSDRTRFVHHSTPDAGLADPAKRWRGSTGWSGSIFHTLSAFGADLIAVGRWFAERYTENENKWKTIPPPPVKRFDSEALKLNESALLLCGSLQKKYVDLHQTRCYVYNLESDQWIDGPLMKVPTYYGNIALVDQTVYAFGGDLRSSSDGRASTIQTLDISNGIENAQWKLEKTALKTNHTGFGVWVIDEPQPKPRSSEAYVVVYVVCMFLIAAAAIIVFVRSL